jgi:predicted acetylornithine/succinylornithine family transaminase
MKFEDIKKLDEKYILQTYKRYPVALVEGSGCRVWDSEGNEFLDLIAGIAVCVLGHNHPRLVHAISEQARKLMHVSNLFYTQHQAELGQMLNDLAPMSCKAFFCNSGTEANEAAIKFARKFTGKTEIIAMHNSFHGRTLGSLAITDKEKYQKPFRPLMPGGKFVGYGDLEGLRKAVTNDTAAVFMELIQGEGGVKFPKEGLRECAEYFRGVQDMCSDKGVVLVVDEVQTGMGRTGKFFCCEHFGIEPGIITMAKGLAGGFPIGATLVENEIAKSITAGDHASTFGGNPLACMAAKTTIETILEEGLMENAKTVGEYFMKKLKDARGLGLLIGMDVGSKEKADKIRLEMQGRGILINVAAEKVLRFAPPLIIGKNEVDLAVDNLKEVVRSCS